MTKLGTTDALHTVATMVADKIRTLVDKDGDSPFATVIQHGTVIKMEIEERDCIMEGKKYRIVVEEIP